MSQRQTKTPIHHEVGIPVFILHKKVLTSKQNNAIVWLQVSNDLQTKQ